MRVPNETFPSTVSPPPKALRIFAVPVYTVDTSCLSAQSSFRVNSNGKKEERTAFPSPSPTSVAVLRKYLGCSLTLKTRSTSSLPLSTLSLCTKVGSIVPGRKMSNFSRVSVNSRVVRRRDFRVCWDGGGGAGNEEERKEGVGRGER